LLIWLVSPQELITVPPLSRKIATIVFSGYGGSLSLAAIRWCAENKIELQVLNWDGALPDAVLVASARHDKELVRRQHRARPLIIAKAIVSQKIESCASFRRQPYARDLIAEAACCHTVAQCLRLEAKAAGWYWAHISERLEIRARPRNWPAKWSHWFMRREITGSGPRRSRHPFNSLLNYGYGMATAAVARELQALGAHLPKGYLHRSSSGIDLALDCVELVRPLVDDKVLGFVAETKFQRGDFPVTDQGEVRMSPALRRVFAPDVALDSRDIAAAAKWIIGEIIK
jgi:CRISPR-associated protein Cas1